MKFTRYDKMDSVQDHYSRGESIDTVSLPKARSFKEDMIFLVAMQCVVTVKILCSLDCLLKNTECLVGPKLNHEGRWMIRDLEETYMLLTSSTALLPL